jgi:hypothetical protein
MLKAIQRCPHLFLDSGIARGKGVAKHLQQREIDLIRAVGIGRMGAWMDVGRIVIEQIEDPLALMVMSADQFRMHWNMIGDQRGCYDALAPPKVFGRMLGLDCGPLNLKLLTITARMNDAVNELSAARR